ncbi:MAG: isochorismatase family protein [Alphaproteobacteria bacterium]|nr:isochorismatase family protein [Alphaproteobacteria bacterium]
MAQQDLNKDYAGAGYNLRLGFGERPAVILIDFVEAYFDKTSPLYAGVDAALASAMRVRDAARRAGVPVIYTNVVYSQGGYNGGMFIKKVPTLHIMEKGRPMGAWPKGLTPNDDELVISKQYPSAFFGTSLSSTLTAHGIDTLILTGLTTSGCVRATCIDTVSYGFRPMVVREACGDRDARPHEANLFDMNAKYADVVGEQETIAYLARFDNRRPAKN